MDEEVEDLKSDKLNRTLKFLGGFLGWFIANTLIYALLNRSSNNWFGVYYEAEEGNLLWVVVLLGNLIALIVLAILKKTRWIALGIISAMATNFAINMMLMQFQGAYCFFPVTYIAPAKNRYPIGYLNGYKGKVDQDHCVAYGWAVDPDDRNADVNIKITSDAKVIAEPVANIYRRDLKIFQRCPGGTCGFEVDLWYLITPDVEHNISVLVQDAQTGIWTSLAGSYKKIECLK